MTRRSGAAHSPAKGVGARAIIVAAGPAANFVLAIVIFAAIFSLYGRQSTTPRVDTVVAGSPAAAAGFQPGDVVKSIDGHPIDNFTDLQRIVSVSAGTELAVAVDRGGEPVALNVTPELQTITDNFGNEHRVGVLGIQRNLAGGGAVTERYPLPQAIGLAASETWFITERTVAYLYRGDRRARIGRSARRTDPWSPRSPARWRRWVSSRCSILRRFCRSASGSINLFPVPMLDGGHLLFFGIEAAPRPAAQRARPGHRFPHRLRGGCDVNDFRIHGTILFI